MNHVRISDWQDHSGLTYTKPLIKQGLQVQHIRLTRLIELGIHAMIGSQRQSGSLCMEFLPVAIHHRVELIGYRCSRCVLVLNVISGGEVHQVGPKRAHQLDPRIKNKLRQFC